MVISLATESSGRNENMHVHTHACARRTSYTPGTHTHVCNQPRAKHHEQPALLPPPPGTLRRGPAEGPGGRGSSTATRSLVLPLAGRVVNCSRPCLVRSEALRVRPGALHAVPGGRGRAEPADALRTELGDPDAHRTRSRPTWSPIPGELNPKLGLEP